MTLPALSADQLKIYNAALRICKERKLTDTEDRKPRRILDDIWDDGFVDHCLEEGLWTFATRTAQVDYDPSIDPDFGYQFAFRQPTDFIRTTSVCSDEFYVCPLTDYADEAGYWWASLDTIFVKYISNDPAYGGDTSKWSPSFRMFLEASLAMLAVGSLTQSDTIEERVTKYYKQMRKEARSITAMNQPAKFMPRGSWALARMGDNTTVTTRRA